MEKKYIVTEKSLSAHCCFKFTVVDTSAGKSGEFWNKSVCETFDKESADLIAEALNKLEEK